LFITCRGGDNFVINGKNYKFIDLSCKKKIVANIEDVSNEQLGCPETLKSIGFNIADHPHITYFYSCFNKRTLNVIWTIHGLDGRALQGMFWVLSD
jgi:hypothetical protein